jgi:hypothetical protein
MCRLVVELTIALLDSVAAGFFLLGAVFFLMVAYSERRAGTPWLIFGATGTIWFVIMFIKLISNMLGSEWPIGTVRATVGISLFLYMLGMRSLAKTFR